MARNHFVTAETENVPSDARRENRAELSIDRSIAHTFASIPTRIDRSLNAKQKPVAPRVFIVVAKSQCDYNGQGSARLLACEGHRAAFEMILHAR